MRFTWNRHIRILAVALVAVISSAHINARFISTSTTEQAHASSGLAGSVPAGLPNRVFLGLANKPNDLGWMTSTGSTWDSRYQYLTAGWTSWSSTPGTFPASYMQASGAIGAMPVFSYYTLLNSGGWSGAEGSTDYAHLNSGSTMSSYFNDFHLLLSEARSYGKPVIIQVEPDLWGFMEQRAGSCGQASCISATVGSSGNPLVSGYANTLQGFAQALLHLRDTTAPNVIMAIHASCWGSGADVCNNPVSNDDTAAHAAHDAMFISSTGSGWNVVFTDTSDRDAGYYQAAQGNKNHWWDTTDRTLPNFANFRTWLSGINSGTSLRIVLWQTPLGNQYFTTDNNANGHYQDNRAEYFLGDGPGYGHLNSFANVGVIGLLFGSGMTGQTENTDGTNDGVSNPGASSMFQCNNCNSHAATFSDDDGGYLRIFGGAYLRSGGVQVNGSGNSVPQIGASQPITVVQQATNTPIPASTSTSIPSSTPATSNSINTIVTGSLWSNSGVSNGTINRGASENFNSAVMSGSTVSGQLIDYEIYAPWGGRVWQSTVSSANFASGVTWTSTQSWSVPMNAAPGTYTLKIGVFGNGWSHLENWNNSAVTFTVK